MIYKDPSFSIPERVADLLARMTTAEKAAQLMQVFVTADNREAIIERIRRTGLGSRILADSNLAGNISQQMAEVDDLNALQRVAVTESRLGIPLLHGRDVIHGHRTIFPIPLGMAASWNPALVREAFAISAREAAGAGVHWTFAPMLDIARDPRWGRIIEGFGEDPYLVSQMAAAAVRGLQGEDTGEGLASEHILACAKHFVGYGAAEGGRDYDTTEISETTLHNVYLPPFKAAVEAGVGSVMSGFHELNGEPVSGSHYLLTEILKEAWGFSGFVVSDWGSVTDMMAHRVAANHREAAALAFNAGVDMEMVSDAFDRHLVELVDEGMVATERLDDACRRVLTAKFKSGLFERPYTISDNMSKIMFAPTHQAAARQMAAESIVLLQNNGLLPLSPTGKTIAVIGPLAQERRALLGSWVSDGLTAETVTLVEAVQAVCPEANLLTASGALSDEMLMQAAKADVVVLAVGESNLRTGENNNVASLALPVGREVLVQAAAGLGKPVVLVVFAGRPVLLSNLTRYVDAILYAWHPGSLGAMAVADILFGNVNPSGKLPVTFPRTEGQIPIYYNRKSTGKPWGKYNDIPATPLFPFGYGLSYTTFAYSDVTVQAKEGGMVVTAVVTNTGSCKGTEIVQCYVQDCVASITRPVRELKGFTRISLEPGQSQVVTFELDSEALSFYGRKRQHLLEPGEYMVWVGGDSCADEVVKGTIS